MVVTLEYYDAAPGGRGRLIGTARHDAGRSVYTDESLRHQLRVLRDVGELPGLVGVQAVHVRVIPAFPQTEAFLLVYRGLAPKNPPDSPPKMRGGAPRGLARTRY